MPTIKDVFEAALKGVEGRLSTRMSLTELVRFDVEDLVQDFCRGCEPNRVSIRRLEILNPARTLSEPMEVLVHLEAENDDGGSMPLSNILDGTESGMFAKRDLRTFMNRREAKGLNMLLTTPFTDRSLDVIGADLTQLLEARYEAILAQFQHFRASVRMAVVRAQDRAAAQEADLRAAIARSRVRVVRRGSGPDVTRLERRRLLGAESGRDFCLTDAEFDMIVSKLRDVGVHFERAPGAYGALSENHLRDIALAILNASFEWLASGETFNNSGKTDILIRAPGQQSWLFVAELKKWRGAAAYAGPSVTGDGKPSALRQLFGYLTWREGKATLMHFARNDCFLNVLSEAQRATREDASFVEGSLVGRAEGWFESQHRHPDTGHAVRVAHLLVNLHVGDAME